MRYTPASIGLALFGLLVLSGCQSNPSRETVDAPLLLNAEILPVIGSQEQYDGVMIYLQSPASIKAEGWTTTAEEGKDLKLEFTGDKRGQTPFITRPGPLH